MEAFLGTIMMWAPNFAPRGWAFCNGQLMSIAQNSALFSLLGTAYGGDGQTTFGLPNLTGRIPIGSNNSQGPGLSRYDLGQSGGSENNTLLVSQMPMHTHGASVTPFAVQVSDKNASISVPTPGARIAVPGSGDGRGFTGTLGFESDSASSVRLADDSIAPGQVSIMPTGGGTPVNNLPPYLGINFIIALQGIFPSRN